VNATSIASATGIPRETVRRKLKHLLKLGVIVEKGRARYVLKPGVLQEPERQAAFARGIQQTVLFMNECLENGVVRWVDGKAKRK
jgi:DNA-binding IclR family transcriptional regulator